jgi:hypothetical protein
MAKVTAIKLLSFSVPNKVGQLAAVTALLGDAGVSMGAIRAAEAGSNAEIVLAVKNPAKAKKALAPLGVEAKESDALCIEMPNKAGRFQKVAKKLADAGVNIQSSWGTAFTGKTASAVIVPTDIAKALAALKKLKK